MKRQVIASAAFTLATVVFTPSQAATIDEEAAKALAKKNDCFTCHAVDKTKTGPAFKKVALKYKGKADGEEKLIKQITTGPKIKSEDGAEYNHKIIDTKDQAQIKNLVGWILSL